MGDNTGIQWANATWNPTTGCTHVSAGCDHCYAETMANRLMHMGVKGYEQGFTYTEHPDRLAIPIRWKRPRRIFVNSMSDLFHEHATFDFISDVFGAMFAAPQHIYQILTKRPGKMRSWVIRICHERNIAALPAHIWLGTSVEDQRVVTARLLPLIATPAAVRFLSCEPLLGPLDLTPHLDNVAWVIAGCESGHGARLMDEHWVRGLRDQCVETGTAFFYKQRLDERGHKVGLPILDGRQWAEFPA